MTGRAVTWPVALWLAVGLNKVALLGYQLALGQLGGPAGLGAHATVVATAGLWGGLLHAGLPDWAMYRAAEARAGAKGLSPVMGGGHALFLVSAVLAYAGVAAALPWLVPDAGVQGYGALVVAGLFLPHLSAYTLSTLRGLGEPRREALATFAGAVTLGVGALAATSTRQLGLAFVLAGGCLLAPLGFSLRDEALRARFADVRRVVAWLKEGLPYLALGLGWMVLWSSDTFVTRAFSSTEEVGLLAATVMILHGGLYGSSLFGSLLIHRVRAGRPGVRALLLGLGPALAALATAASWVLHGLLARRFGIDEEVLRRVLLVASCLSPVGYTATLWMPVAIGLSPGRVRRALVGGVLVAAVTGVALSRHGAVGGLVAMAAGQALVLALVGPVVLRARPKAPATAPDAASG